MYTTVDFRGKKFTLLNDPHTCIKSWINRLVDRYKQNGISYIYIYIYIYIYNICVCVCIYQSFVRAGCNKINKRSLRGLNSEFSFSETGCHAKAKEPNLPLIYP